MAGLVPAIHAAPARINSGISPVRNRVDGRVEHGHDGVQASSIIGVAQAAIHSLTPTLNDGQTAMGFALLNPSYIRAKCHTCTILQLRR
jgi:hypothetical protein